MSNIYNFWGHTTYMGAVGTPPGLTITVSFGCWIFKLQIYILPLRLRFSISLQDLFSQRDDDV
ncbi:hypothetical protein BS47DRAFT_1348451 [Hydnum rufescens UP504]|uniref:Uncharacterized protein n=1 Tax=Hydnum rufescens UP504 TaxID=1448309 RepID=A0A9P6AQE6_9AGAM|nr:hypothetical protein BS47DRAFT_1348451 [Hydnum rufescens UP504]